jgi:hypothetical protein
MNFMVDEAQIAPLARHGQTTTDRRAGAEPDRAVRGTLGARSANVPRTSRAALCGIHVTLTAIIAVNVTPTA